MTLDVFAMKHIVCGAWH